MVGYAELDGVRIWYDERGAGRPLVLLHGGVVDSRFFSGNVEVLAVYRKVYAVDLRGHGHSPDVPGPISYELLSGDLIAFLEQVVGEPADLVGHSLGGNVAMWVALRRPELVRRLVLISADFHEGYQKRGQVDVDAAVAAFGPAYAEVSPDGLDHFPELVRKVARLVGEGPTMLRADLPGIAARTLVLAGDDDEISLEHTIALYRALPEAELAVVPGTSHFLLQEKPAACNAILVEFLTGEPVPTIAPIRRATPVS